MGIFGRCVSERLVSVRRRYLCACLRAREVGGRVSGIGV